ncbi:phage portal protein, partial [Streptococcus agalactiae]|nr:phage portal protein [Streptococcus agalactiae]
MLLHGNAYIQVLRDGDGGAAALYALRPERVSVEVDAGGWPAAYRYRVGERVTRLAADGPRPDIVHIRSFNPLDDHYGMGCLAVAAGPIAIHNAAARWNKALLDNAARPSGALVYDPGDGSAL